MAIVKKTYKQIAEYLNKHVPQYLGKDALVAEDLSNIVDIGQKLQDIDGALVGLQDNLALTIGLSIYVDRPYKSDTPNIFRTNVEYGQIIRKTRTKLPQASNNNSWKLVNGASYDDNQFIEDEIATKIFAEKSGYEVRKSVLDIQIKGAFDSPSEMSRYISMLFTAVYNSLEVQRDSLVMATINNFVGEVRNVNKATQNIKLVTEYNTLKGTSLTADKAIVDADFLKYATGRIKHYQKAMTKFNTLFSATGAENHTPKEMQHLVLLDEFEENASTYLSSSTFHDEFVKLPYHETVPFWQGTGNALDEERDIKIAKTASGATNITIQNVIGVLFDHDALGVWEEDPRTKTHYVNSAEFTNYWFKQDVRYFNDLDEAFILFTLE